MRIVKYICLIMLFTLRYGIIIAAPSDHGRGYSIESNNSFGFDDLVGWGILFVVLSVGIWCITRKIFCDDSCSNENNASKLTLRGKGNTGHIPFHLRFETCPYCNGRGWNKGKQYFGRICFTCGGSGHIPSPKALSLLKEYDERKRIKGDEDRRFTMYKALLIYKEYEKELGNCPPCPDCCELRNIKDSDIFRDYDGKEYIKVTCDRCKGTGRINYY